jgi:hypothetical protein
MRMRDWVEIPLMKTIGRSKFAPITHWISDVTPGAAAGGGYYSVPLHAEPIRSRPLVLLLRINPEVASRCRLRSHTNINGCGHQTSITFHDIDVLLGKRNFNSHSRRVMWLIRCDMVGAAGAHVATGGTTTKQQE